MQRAAKIVATIGPASSSPEILLQMMQAGLDVVRLNFSHGTADDHRQRAEMVREAARKVGREIAIMADPGPKIRVGKFENGKTTLEPGRPSSSTRAASWATTSASGRLQGAAA